MKIYAELWSRFNQQTFLFNEAASELKIPKERLSVIISELNKSGWIEVELDKNDARKRRYKLKKPDEIITGMTAKIN